MHHRLGSGSTGPQDSLPLPEREEGSMSSEFSGVDFTPINSVVLGPNADSGRCG
jgi:hypothetical protein